MVTVAPLDNVVSADGSNVPLLSHWYLTVPSVVSVGSSSPLCFHLSTPTVVGVIDDVDGVRATASTVVTNHLDNAGRPSFPARDFVMVI